MKYIIVFFKKDYVDNKYKDVTLCPLYFLVYNQPKRKSSGNNQQRVQVLFYQPTLYNLIGCRLCFFGSGFGRKLLRQRLCHR
jgi:hypothetical protein